MTSCPRKSENEAKKRSYQGDHEEDTLIDFLDPKYSSYCEISTEGVTDDYYALENLISTDARKRSLGFMAYGASKPPIEITLKLKWKINLRILKIHTVLSSLKSTKLKVFVQCTNHSGNEVTRNIGYGWLRDGENGLCLKSEEVESVTNDSNLKVHDMLFFARQSVKSVNVIKIAILDTKLARAPVIKKIEVWGLLSIYASKSDYNEVKQLYNSNNSEPANSLNNPRRLAQSVSPDKTEPGFSIPEEFLDSITHELLVMPYILPSGNVIDETTMEKHNKHEESYGRLPSDPFTGLIYTADSQPKFNASLKARLDEFKLRNSHEIDVKKSGRSLGKKEKPVATSSYAVSGHVSKKINLSGSPSDDLDSLISSIYRNNQVSVFTKVPQVAESQATDCGKCRSSSPLNLYRISCSHIFCKPCIVQMNSKCCDCDAKFQSKDVEKVNI